MKPKPILKASNPFSEAQMAQALARAPDVAVADVDCPATTEADWADAVESRSYAEFKDNMAKKRMGRPLSAHTKTQVAIRFDADILAALKATGRGWQTRVNEMVRRHLHELG